MRNLISALCLSTGCLEAASTNAIQQCLLDPLQVFKLSAIYNLHSALDVLGPVGQYAVYHFGDRLPLILTGLLLGWIVLTFGIAYVLFSRKGDS